jgi:hypothetical protein
VAELGERMSYSEFIEWQAFYELEPWGTDVEDGRWENYYRMFWSANSDIKKNPPPYRFLDRDPEETERLKREAETQISLDEKIRAFFGSRTA